MDFYSKIKELEYIHSKIEQERLGLEKKIESRKEYQKMFYDIRAQEVKEELNRIEQQRVKNQIRNDLLMRRVQDTLQATYSNDILARSKDSLVDAKKQFLKDLNKRDPMWREKMRNRKVEEIKHMELARGRMVRELQDRQRQFEEEQMLTDQLRNMHSDYQLQQNQLQEVERQRMRLKLEHEINIKKNELEQMEHTIIQSKRQEMDEEDQQQQQKAQKQFTFQENSNPNNHYNSGASSNNNVNKMKPPIAKKDTRELIESKLNEYEEQKQEFDFTSTAPLDLSRDKQFSPYSKMGEQQILEQQVDEDFDDFLDRKASQQEEEKKQHQSRGQQQQQQQQHQQQQQQYQSPKHYQQQEASPSQQHQQQQQSPSNTAFSALAKQQQQQKQDNGPVVNQRVAETNKQPVVVALQVVQSSEKMKQEGFLEPDETEEEVDEDEEEEYYDIEDVQENDIKQASNSKQQQQQQLYQQQAKQQPVQKQQTNPIQNQKVDTLSSKRQQEQQVLESEEQEELEEEEEEEDEEEIKPIKIVNKRLEDTFMECKDFIKFQFVCVVIEYIEQNMGHAADMQVFENTRKSKQDQLLKLALIAKYNESLQDFSSSYYSELDMRVVCDILLDTLRYKQLIILDAEKIVADDQKSIKQGGQEIAYNLNNFMQRMKNQYYAMIVKGIFKLIVKLGEAEGFNNLDTVAHYVTESLLTAEQDRYQADMRSVVTQVLNSMARNKKNEISSMVEAASPQNEPLRQQDKPQLKQQLEQISAQIVPLNMDDELRINIARELKEKIEKKIQQSSSSSATQPIYNSSLLSAEQLLHLQPIAKKIKTDKYIPKDLSTTDMAALLLMMLGSRPVPNIDQKDLAYIEESIDLADFKGFFRDQNVKQLFDIIMKHMILCIKKKLGKQKDIEVLFTKCVINFNCSEVDQSIIKQYIADSLSKALGQDNNGSNNMLNAGSGDFYQQQQQFHMKRSKLMSNSTDKYGGVGSPSPASHSKQLKEFDDPEILDDY